MDKVSGKRNRDPLAINNREIKYQNVSQRKMYYLEGSKARILPPERRKRSKKARIAVSYAWNKFKTPEKIIVPVQDLDSKTTQDYYTSRRMSIYYLFITFGAPEPDTWTCNKVVNKKSYSSSSSCT
jgi:hypothetical protein